MKQIITSLLMIVAIATAIKAQIKSDDLGRIVLNTYLPENINLPAEVC